MHQAIHIYHVEKRHRNSYYPQICNQAGVESYSNELDYFSMSDDVLTDGRIYTKMMTLMYTLWSLISMLIHFLNDYTMFCV